MTAICAVEEVTAAWLTGVLRQSGALVEGQVVGFQALTGTSNWSSNARLQLSYSPQSSGPCPATVFLKLVQTSQGGEDCFGDSEVRYYLEDYVDWPRAPLLKCYDGAYEAGRYHLLLEDVSQTHQPSVHVPPTLEYGCALARALAVLHVRWWFSRREIPMVTAAQVQRYVSVARPGLAHVLDDPDGVLDGRQAEVLRQFFLSHPHQMVERLKEPNGFALVHGDLNGFNILVPYEQGGPLYLIDRQPFEWSLTTWLGVGDLAFVLISDWSVEARRSCEQEILRAYHQALVEEGVEGYSWTQLWEDYRLCLPMGIYCAVEFCKHGVDEPMRARWMSLLDRSLAVLEEDTAGAA